MEVIGEEDGAEINVVVHASRSVDLERSHKSIGI